MRETFSERARSVMALANLEAQRFNHEYIGTEHMLLGLVRLGSGGAADVCAASGVDMRRVRVEVEQRIRGGIVDPGPSKQPKTLLSKRAIEYAFEEARSVGQQRIGTEHLLLGLLREPEGVAGQLLRSTGLDIARARQLVIQRRPETGEGR